MEGEQLEPNIWTYLKELAMVVWGPNKDNGLRSVVSKHEDRIDSNTTDIRELDLGLKSYMESGRKMTCYGLQELARRDREDITLRTTKVNAKAAVIAAIASSLISAAASVTVVLITILR